MGATLKKLSGKNKKAAGVILAALILLAVCGWSFYANIHGKAGLPQLTAEMALFIRAEDLPPDKLNSAGRRFIALKAKGPGTAEALEGAGFYLAGDYRAALDRFALLAEDQPEDLYLPSLAAAAAYRGGDQAAAENFYLKALVLKSEKGLGGLELSSDQLGLALALMFQGRPEDALPLAESGWRSRRAALGAGHIDTLAAANRLAAVYVALGLNGPAEDLLKSAFAEAAADYERTSFGLAETAHLLTILYEQSGRQAELDDFFSQWPLALPDGIEPPAYAAAAIDPQYAARLKDMGNRLIYHDPALSAELMRRALKARPNSNGLKEDEGDYRADMIQLVKALVLSGQYGQADENLLILMGGSFHPKSPDFLTISDLAAMSLSGQGRLDEAEIFWQTGADIVDRRLEDRGASGKKGEATDAAWSLELHGKLADLLLAKGRVPQEAEIELLSALGRLDKYGLNGGPARAEIYLRLGSLYQSLNKRRESSDYFKRAAEAAEKLLPVTPEPENFRLEAVISLAAEEGDPSGPQALPSIDIMRLEFDALKSLGRARDIQERLLPVVGQAARKYGRNDRRYMAWFTFAMKTLEEAGLIEELTAELLMQAADPPGRNEAEKILNSGGALIYAARVAERHQQKDKAVEFYTLALNTLSSRNEDPIKARRKLVEEAMKRLTEE